MAEVLRYNPLRMMMTTEAEYRADVEYWREREFERQLCQGQLAAPMVISDTMDPVQSMLDGQMYDSKSNLRRTYKAAGVTEVGNDSSVLDKDKVQNHNRRRKMKTQHEKDQNRARVQNDVRKAISRNNLTRHRKDEVKVG